MSEIEIGAKISVDSSSANKSINDLQNSLKESKRQMNEAAIGSHEYKEAQKKVKESTDQLNKATDSSGGAFGVLKGKLMDAVPGLKGAEQGTVSLQGQLLKLAANPIVLIITALVLIMKALFDAFMKSDEGAQKFQAIMDGIGAVIQELQQRILHIANAIGDLLTGNFKGALEEGKKATENFGDAMVDSFSRGKEASNMLDDVADSMRVLDIQQAAMNQRLAKSKEVMSDENATLADKKKALKESGDEIEKYYGKVAENDNKYLAAIAKKYNVEDAYQKLVKQGFENGAKEFDDYLQKLAIGTKGIEDIEGALKKSINSQTEYSTKQRAQNKLEKNLDKQEQSEADAAAKEQNQKYKERKKEIEQAAKEHARELEIIAQNHKNFMASLEKMKDDEKLLLITDAFEKEKFQLGLKLKAEKDAAKKSFEDKKIDLMEYQALLMQINQNGDTQLYLMTKKNKEEKEKKEKEEKEKKETKDQAERDKNAAQAQTDYEKYLQAEIENERAKGEATYEIELEYFNKSREMERQKLVDANASSIALLAFDKQTATQRVKIDKDAADAKKLIEDKAAQHKKSQLKEVGDMMNNLTAIVGKNTASGKIFASAAALINTYLGVTEALKAKSTLPSPFDVVSKVVNAGAVLAAGLKAVKEINAVPVPGGGGGVNPGGGDISTSSPLAPSPQAMTTTLSKDTIDSMSATASRAYVVETDIENGQQRMHRINRAARLA
jgi:hypothetical protein